MFFEPKTRAEEQKLAARINSSHVQAVSSSYEFIFDAFPINFGKELSKKERSAKKLYASSLIYGEIDFDTFGMAIQKIIDIYGKPGVGTSGEEGKLQKRGGMFFDLGSGVGKAVIAAALVHNFDVCTGIEILEELHKGAEDVRTVYETKAKHELDRAFDTVVDMRCGDMLDLSFKNWTYGDVVFMNSTCFDDELMLKLAHLAVGMRKGTFVITTTQKLPSPDFEICEYEMHEMSWGTATIYIQQKTTDAREYDSDDYDSENDL
mmetsp:Transcript_31203/g.58083  ORF Transcript_31203/g.58083 Transcript_31203/m.58083 type:complete len:263 (+) Transcript_31203:87-875(+)